MDTQTKEQRRRIMRAVKSRDTASATIVGRFPHGLRSRNRPHRKDLHRKPRARLVMRCDEQQDRIHRRIVELPSNGHSSPQICGICPQDLATRWPLAARWILSESWGETAS